MRQRHRRHAAIVVPHERLQILRLLRRVAHLPSVVQRSRQRLLARHMFPRLQRRDRHFAVQMIWRADVYYINFLVPRQFFQGTVGAVETKRVGAIFCSVRTTPENAGHRHAQSSQRFYVSSADKTNPDHRRPQVLHHSPQEFEMK